MSLIQTIQVGSVARIWLNRPEVLNALSGALQDELIAAVRDADSRPDTAVILIAGRGRAFSAGSDRGEIAALRSGTEEAVQAAFARGERLTLALLEARATVICAVHGYCVGGAVSMVLASDLTVAAAGTQFFIPEVDLALPYLWRSTPLLVAAVGLHRAKHLMLTAERFGPEEAARAGLVTQVIEEDQLDGAALELAGRIAAKPRAAVEHQKQLTNKLVLALIRKSGDEIEMAVASLLVDRDGNDDASGPR